MSKGKKKHSVTVVGTGVMGGAIATALAASCEVLLYDKNFDKAETLAKGIAAKAVKELPSAISGSAVVLLAIKPIDLAPLSGELLGLIQRNQIIASILTGVSIHELKRHFRDHHPLRMMLNLPVVYGKGAVALADNGELSGQERAFIEGIFAPLGLLQWIQERKMNAFTALAGSGPAFAFMMIESIVDAGIALGLSATEAQNIATQMLLGSITTLQETKKHPGELKWNVTSPGGCTIAGVKAFEAGAVRSGIINTFIATYERIEEMSKV